MDGKKEQMINLKNDLIVTTLEDEGLIVDIETRKTFWLSESACYLLQIFQKNSDGFPLSLTKSFLSAKYNNINTENVSEDIDCFINDLKRHNLLSTRMQMNGNNIKIRNFTNKRIYIKPIMEEEFDNFPITRAAVISGAQTYAPAKSGVSPAVRQSRRSGQMAY